MENIAKMINGRIHTAGCTLSCDYCCLAQVEHKNDRETYALKYPLETVLKACSKERLGGTAFIQIIGDGETLLPKDAVPLIHGLLKEGHFVQVITNGTLGDRIRELVEKAEKDKLKDHLLISFSLHFLELEKRNLLESYAENVNYVKEQGVSFRVSIVCGDGYLEAADRIHKFCREKLEGITLNVGSTKEFDKTGNCTGIYSKYSKEVYYEKVRESFSSHNFEYISDLEEMDNHKFCYAGKWYFQLDFTTGMYSQCLMNEGFSHNFFEHLEEELETEPVGTGCRASFCWCGWAKKLNLIPGECGYVEPEQFASEPENRFIAKDVFNAGFANLAETNRQYSEEEKETHKKRRILDTYFSKQAELLKFDFKDGNYAKFAAEAEKLLQNDLNPRLLYAVELTVWYGYALLALEEWERGLYLSSCYESLHYNADYCMVMGLIYMKNGRIEEAVQLFLEATERKFAIEEGANSYLPYYNLGVIYECLGNMESAEIYYRKCGCYKPAQERLNYLGG